MAPKQTAIETKLGALIPKQDANVVAAATFTVFVLVFIGAVIPWAREILQSYKMVACACALPFSPTFASFLLRV